MTALKADVLVVGGGLGGVACALAAADAGASVVMTEAEPVIGGQVTTQLVAALDEHRLIEQTGATSAYRDFRDRVRARYGGLRNPGGGWVSRLCFEPSVGLDVLHAMLAPHVDAGRALVRTGLRPVSATVTDRVVTAVQFEDAAGASVEVVATVVADATELGDLLPITGTRWTIGSEGSAAFGEAHATELAQPGAEQSCTWCAALVLDQAAHGDSVAPSGYAEMRDGQPFSLTIAGWDGRPHRYRMFEDGPDGRPPFWTYRRLRDGAALGGLDTIVLNWSGNDYAEAGLVADPVRARAGARELTKAFVHWLRTEAPRDDGGAGYPEVRLAPDVAGTADGLAQAPYVREARRLWSPNPVTAADITAPDGAEVAPSFGDSLGVGWYHADMHARVGVPGTVYAPTAPFQIPARALVAPAPGAGNLIAAAKNIAATQVAASAYRVHHSEWAIGEAAGVLAARAVTTGTAPATIVADREALLAVQIGLLSRGAPLVWSSELVPGSPDFIAGQLAAVCGGLGPRRSGRLSTDPEGGVDDDDLRALHTVSARLGGPPPSGATGWIDVARKITTPALSGLAAPADAASRTREVVE